MSGESGGAPCEICGSAEQDRCWGKYTVIRVAAYGDPVRDEWVNIGVLVGSTDESEWNAVMTRDWDTVELRLGLNTVGWAISLKEVAASLLLCRSWVEIERTLDSVGHLMGMVQYRTPRPTHVGKYAHVTALQLFHLFCGTPVEEVSPNF